jgi:aspartyl/glutamyl-tRNA(Asn/Gln) amidotransferase C subunit
MKINSELIDYIAVLSRLELTDQEKEARKKDLSEILDFMDKLGELDLTDAREMTHPFDAWNRFRDDVVTGVDRRPEMLAVAPERDGDYFKVFKTVEE